MKRGGRIRILPMCRKITKRISGLKIYFILVFGSFKLTVKYMLIVKKKLFYSYVNFHKEYNLVQSFVKADISVGGGGCSTSYIEFYINFVVNP